jgi:hypothetical protein
MYRERRPVIPSAVVWQKTSTGPARVLPDGCMDLIWMRHEVVVAGPDTQSYAVTGSMGERYVGVRFPPGVLPTLLGVLAADLRNARAPLPEVTADPRTRLLAERVAKVAVPGRALERFALSRSDGVPDPDGARESVVSRTRPVARAVAATMRSCAPRGEPARCPCARSSPWWSTTRRSYSSIGATRRVPPRRCVAAQRGPNPQ